ncbi:MAG: aminotransferase class I/II-fold pyridoxal phosphate-dependent enzyme [Eubacteriales bacterium]|nr:aminotransferase class I/II-fold pyridoxal phosphate-dependent enzyme [Eubacteriales bacterium]
MQAIILAAGMGKRLKALTNDSTKCMVKVNGVTMAERTLKSLDKLNLNKIVIVVGYKGDKLIEYVNSLGLKTKLEFVDNTVYDKTNNIYSLYLAKDYLLEDDTLLLESDIVFEDAVLRRLVDNPYPSLALVAPFESWMDGTVVTLDEENNLQSFLGKKDFDFKRTAEYYKTVNLYKFGKDFSVSHYVPFLEAYCKALGNNEYYEQVLKVITYLDKPEIKAECLGDEKWYEIDDEQDLEIAETIFAEGNERLDKMQKAFGGYWRYPKVLDFCYLVNPFYPCKKLVDEMQANFTELLTQYPSGQRINALTAAKNWGLKESQVAVGNGAAELIKGLLHILDGKLGVAFPTFQEYPNRKPSDEVVPYFVTNDTFSYTADDLMNFYADKDIRILTLINPDNPSGNYIKRADVLRLADWAKQKGIVLIVDESFVDFCDAEEKPSLLRADVFEHYDTLVVVKSISKSYGVPGIRLGVAASANVELMNALKKEIAIWNINSYGEFFLQIQEKYNKDYAGALERFYEVRNAYMARLAQIKSLRVIPTQANFVLCEVLGNLSSTELTERLLNDYNIFIKDLSTKKGFDGRNYIRLAVRTTEDNDRLVDALAEILD